MNNTLTISFKHEWTYKSSLGNDSASFLFTLTWDEDSRRDAWMTLTKGQGEDDKTLHKTDRDGNWRGRLMFRSGDDYTICDDDLITKNSTFTLLLV